MTAATSSAAASRPAQTVLLEHAAATAALQYLVEVHPGLPAGLVDLSAYRSEREDVGEAREQLTVQVLTLDALIPWARVLQPTEPYVRTDQAHHAGGRLRAFVTGEVLGVAVHVYALVNVQLVDEPSDLLDDLTAAGVLPTADAERVLRLITGDKL